MAVSALLLYHNPGQENYKSNMISAVVLLSVAAAVALLPPARSIWLWNATTRFKLVWLNLKPMPLYWTAMMLRETCICNMKPTYRLVAQARTMILLSLSRTSWSCVLGVVIPLGPGATVIISCIGSLLEVLVTPVTLAELMLYQPHPRLTVFRIVTLLCLNTILNLTLQPSPCSGSWKQPKPRTGSDLLLGDTTPGVFRPSRILRRSCYHLKDQLRMSAWLRSL
jgi:hypothetical protein